MKQNTRPMLPSIYFLDESGKRKYIYSRYLLETIVNGLHKDLSEIQVGSHTVRVDEQIKTDEVWEVRVSEPFVV